MQENQLFVTLNTIDINAYTFISIELLVGSISLNHLHAEFLPPFGVNVQCNGLKPLMLQNGEHCMDECITGFEQSSKYKMEINALSHKLSDKKSFYDSTLNIVIYKLQTNSQEAKYCNLQFDMIRMISCKSNFAVSIV